LAIRIHGESTGVNENEVQRPVSLYMDNTNTLLNIKSGQFIKSLSIVDVSGKIRVRKNIDNQFFHQTVNVSMLNSGIYIAKIETNTNSYSLKFVK
jgi:hypothetical protein